MPNVKTKELDTSKETLLNSYINWGVEVYTKIEKEKNSILRLRAIMANTEPADETILSPRAIFILSGVDTSKCEEDYDDVNMKNLEYHIPVKDMKETADETKKFILEEIDMIQDMEFKAFKEKKDLMNWATDLKS